MRVLVNIGVVILVLLTLLPQTPAPNTPAIKPNMVAKAASALSNRVQPRVIGGAIADVTQLGGYVYIRTPKNWCNGALIHPEWVITTIACIHDMGNKTQTPVPTSTAIPDDGKTGILSPSQITVNVGCAILQNYTCRMDPVLEQVYGSKSQKFKVSSIHVHPNRGENFFVSGFGTWPDPAYDVVLLHLTGQVQVGPGIVPFTLGQVNDDISRIDVSDVFTSGIRIGNTLSQVLSVSNNGVVGLGEVAELPANLPLLKTWLGNPLIAPFAADVDTRSGAMRPLAGTKTSGANAVWVDQDVSSHQVTITWDDVRPYPDMSRLAVSNSFQLQLTVLTPSITKVTFLYDAIQWTYGENSCGKPCNFKKAQHAQVGISAGDGKTAWMHKASGKASNLRQLAETVTVYLFDGKIHTTLPIERPTSVLPATSTTVATAVPLPDGSGPSTDALLAWYPLNGIRTTGSTLPAQVGTIMGAAQYFDGVNDYHQTTIDLANTSFTVAFWAAFDWKDRYQIVVGGGSAANTNQGLMIGGIKDLGASSTAATFYCGFYSNDLYYELPDCFDQSAWHHYACTYDKNTQVRKIIIDGVVVTSDSSVAPLQTTSEFWLGRSPWNDSYFKRSLRDVMVYKRALGKNEINHIKDITPKSIMLSESHPASACRWIDKGGMVHEYEINHDLLTWEQAQREQRGGQLHIHMVPPHIRIPQ